MRRSTEELSADQDAANTPQSFARQPDVGQLEGSGYGGSERERSSADKEDYTKLARALVEERERANRLEEQVKQLVKRSQGAT